MLRVWILLAWISCYCSTSISSQDLDAQYVYAQDQYAVGNIDIALKEYLRTYYFDREGIYESLPSEIANCFVELNDYKHALDFYDLYLNQPTISNSDRFSAQLRKSQINLLNNDPNTALVQLLSISTPNNIDDSNRYNFLLGFTYLVNSDIESGFSAINNLSYIQDSHREELQNFKKDLEKNLSTNHNIPRLMSAIIPGTGQIVNGELADAANSMLLTGGLLFLLVDVAKELTLLDALASVGPFYFRYYLGGINNAQSGSINKEKRKESQLLSEFLLFIKDCKSASIED